MRILRWTVLIGCFIAYLFDAFEITLLSLALPAIRHDLGLSGGQAGLLATATLLGIGVSSLAIGYLADNFGRKKALILSLAAFGVFTSALWAVPGFGTFLVIRFLAGLGLGGVWSVVSAYITETWPDRSRNRASAFVISAFPIGGALAAVTSGLFLPDWRLMFLIAGLLVALPILIVAAFFRESSSWLADRTDSEKPVVVGDVLRGPLRRATLLGTLMAALALIGFWGSSTWLPTYLGTERGLSPASVAWSLTALNLGMFLGYNAFGVLADRIGQRAAILLSLVGVTIALPVYALTTRADTLLWLGPLYGFCTAFFGLFGAYLGELFPTRVRTTGVGFCFNVGRGISAFAPFALIGVAGAIGFSGGLVVCALFFGLSAVVVAVLPTTRSAVPQDTSVQY
ncbi:MFS transporter [Kutzneria chonburiensis]|uniref:MFS transporter n=1 Tax=Kutzneria chonburiensis TaxID=1483604 RepID=A0ABV6MS72_9PSEU|nr:MFS transporter [Kutzneria chonburiensis]